MMQLQKKKKKDLENILCIEMERSPNIKVVVIFLYKIEENRKVFVSKNM